MAENDFTRINIMNRDGDGLPLVIVPSVQQIEALATKCSEQLGLSFEDAIEVTTDHLHQQLEMASRLIRMRGRRALRKLERSTMGLDPSLGDKHDESLREGTL